MRIPDREECVVGEDGEGVRAGRQFHHAPDAFFPGPLPMQNQEGQQLAVGTGYWLDTALPHQPAELQRVNDVAVVPQRERLIIRLDQDRLRVLDARTASR